MSNCKSMMVATLVFLGLIVSCAFAPMSWAKEPYKIGGIFAITGGASFLGDPEKKSLQMVVDEINKKTSEFNGMQVPVKIEVDDKKNFTVTVGIPPTTALIKKEVHIEKGSPEPNLKVVGDLPMQAAVRIARMKAGDMLSYDLKNAVKEVVGTCVSMGVNVEGKRPKEILAAIDAGTYDSVLAQ